MIKREFHSKKRYLAAFLIATFIFVLIFSLSYALSYLEFQRISQLQLDSTYSIFEDKLDYSFFNQEIICSTEFLDKVSRDLHFQGRIIDDLENKLGKNHQAVLSRKKFYTLVELEHLEFVSSINKNCDLKINTILFFYSNEKENLKESEEIGRLLGVLSNRNSNLIIYSFDINLDSNLINKLKEKYSVEEFNTVIINEQDSLINPQNIEDIEKYLY